jgi:hypothetical protein
MCWVTFSTNEELQVGPVGLALTLAFHATQTPSADGAVVAVDPWCRAIGLTSRPTGPTARRNAPIHAHTQSCLAQRLAGPTRTYST